MAVVKVGHVWMRVLERLMRMAMRVWLAGRIVGQVRVAMMLVVRVAVVVFQGLVHVGVRVLFAEEEADADEHRGGRRELSRTHRLA